MPLVSPGVSVTITDESFFIPVSAPTVPLFFIATKSGKLQLDGVTPAAGTNEFGVVRTVTSLVQSVALYGIPDFRYPDADASLPVGQRRQMHGDARNEYGLFALNQFLGIGNRAYVVRADVDLTDTTVVNIVADTPQYVGTGDGVLTGLNVNQLNAVAEIWTITATSSTQFSVVGSLSGAQSTASTDSLYNNGIIDFTISAGATPFNVGDRFTITLTEVVVGSPLGATDAIKRGTIVSQMAAQINSNQDVRSEIYEYNLILAPGYHELADEMQALVTTVQDEALVINDTPMDLNPEDTAVWAMTSSRIRSTNNAYYYPSGFASNLDGAEIVCAASGIALRTYAYSDSVSELWIAPAGIRRGLVTGVGKAGYVSGTLGTVTTFNEANLNQGQRDILYEYQKNVNPIAFFPGRGLLVFGQKTSAAAASALDRVNVVRLMAYIKRSLRKGAFSFLFEPNDAITRDNLKAMIDGFLGDIMLKRGLYDFLVLCDESNNTPTRIDRNELHASVALKPVKAAEFIYIPVNILSSGADF